MLKTHGTIYLTFNCSISIVLISINQRSQHLLFTTFPLLPYEIRAIWEFFLSWGHEWNKLDYPLLGALSVVIEFFSCLFHAWLIWRCIYIIIMCNQTLVQSDLFNPSFFPALLIQPCFLRNRFHIFYTNTAG